MDPHASCSDDPHRDLEGSPADITTLVGNVLKGVGCALQASGRLIQAAGGTETASRPRPDLVSVPELQVTGTLVLLGDTLRAAGVAVARFQDAAAAHTAIIDWGDETAGTSGEVVSTGGGGFLVLGSHQYEQPGEFTITARVAHADAALGVATASALVGSPRIRFAAAAFRRLVGRPASGAEVAQIAGATREEVLRSIASTAAFQQRVVRDVYGRLLGRMPDRGELHDGVELVAAGSTAALTARIAASAEYFERRGQAQSTLAVHALYLDLLGRVPNPAEVADAVPAASDPSQRATLVERLLDMPEAAAQTVQLAVRAYAGRDASRRELTAAIAGRLAYQDIAATAGDLWPEVFPTDPSGLPDGAVADFAVQFRLPLSPDQIAQLGSQLAQQIPGSFVDSYVDQEQTLVAAWLSPPDDASRQAWLLRTASGDGRIAVGDYLIGILASANFLKQSAKAGFANAPKRFDNQGFPDPNGDIQLTGIDVEMDSDGQAIVTNVSGVYFIHPFPFVSYGLRFTHHIRDQFGGPVDGTDCAGTLYQTIGIVTQSSQDVDSGDVAVAIGLGLFFLPSLASLPSGGPVGVGGGGVGAGLVANLWHTQLLPGGGKVVFNYKDFNITGSGVVILGSPSIAARVPSVGIDGPTLVPFFLFGPGNTIPRYSVRPCDLRAGDGGQLPVAWSAADPLTRIESPSSPTTKVYFPRPGSTAGSNATHTLTAVVGPDLDGAVREATISVFTVVDDRLPPAPNHRPLQLLPP